MDINGGFSQDERGWFLGWVKGLELEIGQGVAVSAFSRDRCLFAHGEFLVIDRKRRSLQKEKG